MNSGISIWRRSKRQSLRRLSQPRAENMCRPAGDGDACAVCSCFCFDTTFADRPSRPPPCSGNRCVRLQDVTCHAMPWSCHKTCMCDAWRSHRPRTLAISHMLQIYVSHCSAYTKYLLIMSLRRRRIPSVLPATIGMAFMCVANTRALAKCCNSRKCSVDRLNSTLPGAHSLERRAGRRCRTRRIHAAGREVSARGLLFLKRIPVSSAEFLV